MAKYIKQEMPDICKDGSKKCYYRLQSSGNVSTDELIHAICLHGGVGLSESVFRHALQELADELACKLADGYSVTLDGVGVKRNAQSLELKGVGYRTDKSLVKNARARCRLERGGTGRVNRSPHTRAERLQMAKDFLSAGGHPYMRLSDYAGLTLLSRSSASIELRAFAADPASGIRSSGRGSHVVYVSG